jgi:hypothetical protein
MVLTKSSSFGGGNPAPEVVALISMVNCTRAKDDKNPQGEEESTSGHFCASSLFSK